MDSKRNFKIIIILLILTTIVSIKFSGAIQRKIVLENITKDSSLKTNVLNDDDKYKLSILLSNNATFGFGHIALLIEDNEKGFIISPNGYEEDHTKDSWDKFIMALGKDVRLCLNSRIVTKEEMECLLNKGTIVNGCTKEVEDFQDIYSTTITKEEYRRLMSRYEGINEEINKGNLRYNLYKSNCNSVVQSLLKSINKDFSQISSYTLGEVILESPIKILRYKNISKVIEAFGIKGLIPNACIENIDNQCFQELKN